jgi:hypothetical protein
VASDGLLLPVMASPARCTQTASGWAWKQSAGEEAGKMGCRQEAYRCRLNRGAKT